MADYKGYDTWGEVLDAAQRGEMLYYQAPMDLRPHYVMVKKIYKNGKLRIDPLSNQADNFTVDAGHLLRFRRRA